MQGLVPPTPEERDGLLAQAMTQAAVHQSDKESVVWVMSNRVDNRVVIWETDPRHPGGQLLVGGSVVKPAYLTVRVQEAIASGLLVQVPEPTGVKKAFIHPGRNYTMATPPGREILLGRPVADGLYEDDGAKQEIVQAQGRVPKRIRVPDGVVVPVMPKSERESSRR